jgi:hypothetical protein
MANKPTFKQTARIWSHCAAYGSGNIDWAKMGREGGLSKHVASDIIGAITAWEKECIPLTKDSVEELIGGFIDGYTIIKAFNGESKDDAKDAPKAKKKTKAVPTDDDETLDKLLDGLGMFLNKDTLTKLRDAIDQRLTGATDGYQAVIDELTAKLDELREKAKAPRLPELVPMSDDYVKPKLFDRVACYLDARQNVLGVGPAGTGKSRLGREIAKAKGWNVFEQSLGGGMRYAQLIGRTVISDGDSHFELADLMVAVQDPDTLVILNEIFAVDSDVLLALNDMLERDTRQLWTPAGLIKVQCRFLATANTTGRSVSRQYTGAQRADDSLLSRFSAKIVIDYDHEVEAQLLKQIGEKDARHRISDRLQTLRNGISENNIPFDAGTRELISCIHNYAAVGDVDMAFDDAFLGGLSRNERTKLGM